MWTSVVWFRKKTRSILFVLYGISKMGEKSGNINVNNFSLYVCFCYFKHLMTDNINHPKHYLGHPSGIECIQITRHMNFNLGNAIKYIWRADLKNNSIEDLKKAIWYINDEIMKRETKIDIKQTSPNKD